MASVPPEDGSILPTGWTWSDVGHGALDIVGLVPVFGEAADLTNAAWYAAECNYLDAGLSAISTVPIVGDIIGKGGKIAKKAGGKLAGPALDALKKIDFKKTLEPLRKHPKIGPHVDKMAEALEKWRKELVGEAPPCTPGGTQVCPITGKPASSSGTGGKAGSGSRASSIAKTGDFGTPPNKSVFYSGPGNRNKALASGKDGFVAIDNTPGGKALNDENLYSEFSPLRDQADEIWSEASKRFADGASGNVTAYVRGASPSRVFGTTELPALLKNPKVDSINGIPTKLLRHLEDARPGAAFEAVVGQAPL